METVRYESLLLVVPEITNDESAEIEKLIDKKIQSFKGTLISYDRWGKYLLSYPIKKNDYGVYYLARFNVPTDKKSDLLKDLKALFELKLNELIMRNVFTRLDADAPHDYKRPQSLDETPKDVDQFIKENKMSGISSRKYERPEQRRPFVKEERKEKASEEKK